MWHDCLDKNTFIKNLYKQVPSLKDVRIEKLSIDDEGTRVSLGFDMPFYADFPPQKWSDFGYNKIFIEVDLFGVSEISVTSKNAYHSDITIFIDINNMITVKITGSVDATIIAECGLIQKVSGYQY